MKSKNMLKVVKIGGKLIDDSVRLDKLLAAFARLKGNKILVHGGGSLASRTSLKLGFQPQMVEGRRITSAQDIEVVTMVYAGLINKQITASLQKLGCNALGLSGADANSIVADKRPVDKIDYGYVGDIKKVDASVIQKFLIAGLTPVFSAITHDNNGQLLNTNSDTVAAEIAIAMSQLFETELYYCFEKRGVLKTVNDDRSVISVLDTATYQEGIDKGFIQQGMLPKLKTGFDALNKKVNQVFIGNETLLDDHPQFFTRLKITK